MLNFRPSQLAATLALASAPFFTASCLGQVSDVRGYSWGSRKVVSKPDATSQALRTLRVINGKVPIYDLSGTAIPGTQVLYVFVDALGRQRGGAGIGFKSADHRVNVNQSDGVIDAARVRKFAVAQTGQDEEGNVNVFRPGSEKAGYALQTRRTYSSPGRGTAYNAPVTIQSRSSTTYGTQVIPRRTTYSYPSYAPTTYSRSYYYYSR